ncbi:HNH endonuclease [Mycobacterium phage Panamaxus]|nr:HNH endonuclease [Mycobacterium phage Panamaxus]
MWITSAEATTTAVATCRQRVAAATGRSHPQRATPASASYEPGGSDRPNATLAPVDSAGQEPAFHPGGVKWAKEAPFASGRISASDATRMRSPPRR